MNEIIERKHITENLSSNFLTFNKGSDNPLTISRVYSTKFICKFDMGLYPFDQQKCQLQMVMKGNSGNFAQLVKDELRYLGPIDLTQYFVKSWNMNLTQDNMEVEIVLGKFVVLLRLKNTRSNAS